MIKIFQYSQTITADLYSCNNKRKTSQTGKNIFFRICFNCLILTAMASLVLGSCQNRTGKTSNVVDSLSVIQPAVITQPTLNDTDDPAIWINPDDPSQSLVLGTDKGDNTGGIYVFSLDGMIDSTRSVFNLKRPNNIDIEYGFDLNGVKTDIAVFTERGRNIIRVYSLPEMKALDNGGIEVFKDDPLREPMGIGLYKEPQSGTIYAIVSRKSGPDGSYLWQYRLRASADGTVTAGKVREFGSFKGNKEIEAIAVDDELGYVYYSDETSGIRQYYASPDSSNVELSVFGTTGFTEDHEGISIYPASRETGYILVSDQQSDRFQIFSREGTNENPFEHRLLKIINVAARESDGSEVTSLSLNSTFKHGLFVVMSTDRTFHFYRWEDLAGKDLQGAK